ncbi:hypothetical protein [Burkholderia ubonensis]|uniref:Ferritin-like domain-containing protein n=1 Tax=Burkholderia ubonensis subsp. mesacidophila TaxID=265293 RepID=A0A2A4FKF0_9BURK|nr:hypothetical protein [Burkholderia ubonensis]PCE33152.1 hypothetical protein BZL54_07330 [Burkholderia ubonensis subsp. mesacidophila]
MTTVASFVCGFVGEHLARSDGSARDVYSNVLAQALAGNDPPYAKGWFGNDFRRRSRDQEWLISLLLSNVDMEGYSAGRLWEYGARIGQVAMARGIQKHACDEAKHSRMFARIAFSTFPRIETEQLRDRLRGCAPALNLTTPAANGVGESHDFEELLNSLILINLFEIRALFLEKLLTPVLFAHAPEASRGYLERAMAIIVWDEVGHIRYTADFLADLANQGYEEQIIVSMREFQSVLNRLTEKEMDEDSRTNSSFL